MDLKRFFEAVSDHNSGETIGDLANLCGNIVREQATVVKDDGCNTSVIAKTFVDKYTGYA